jgi:spore coat protein CotF
MARLTKPLWLTREARAALKETLDLHLEMHKEVWEAMATDNNLALPELESVLKNAAVQRSHLQLIRSKL